MNLGRSHGEVEGVLVVVDVAEWTVREGRDLGVLVDQNLLCVPNISIPYPRKLTTINSLKSSK